MSEWHFHGCSLSTDLYVENPKDAFPHIVGEYFSKEICIKARPGNSNYIIFTDAIGSLLHGNCEMIFVQLTCPGRMTFHHDWNCKSNTVGKCALDVMPESRWKKFVNDFSLLDQEFNQFELMSYYIPIINRIAELTNKRVHFINGYLHIDPVFLNMESNINYASLKEDTKRILDFDHKDDDDILIQLQNIRKKLSVIEQSQWIMLFDTLSSFRVDRGTDNLHPGIKSNRRYAQLIIKHLERENGK